MLRSDPAARPTIDELLNDEFFTSGYIPTRLPTSCLTMAPRFSFAPSGLELNGRKPLTALNKGESWGLEVGLARGAWQEPVGLQQQLAAPVGNVVLPCLFSHFLWGN